MCAVAVPSPRSSPPRDTCELDSSECISRASLPAPGFWELAPGASLELPGDAGRQAGRSPSGCSHPALLYPAGSDISHGIALPSRPVLPLLPAPGSAPPALAASRTGSRPPTLWGPGPASPPFQHQQHLPRRSWWLLPSGPGDDSLCCGPRGSPPCAPQPWDCTGNEGRSFPFARCTAWNKQKPSAGREPSAAAWRRPLPQAHSPV